MKNKVKCKKIFLPSSLVTESFITDAHSRGVRCAAVLENGVEEIKSLIAAGVDALVTPDVARALKRI